MPLIVAFMQFVCTGKSCLDKSNWEVDKDSDLKNNDQSGGQLYSSSKLFKFKSCFSVEQGPIRLRGKFIIMLLS